MMARPRKYFTLGALQAARNQRNPATDWSTPNYVRPAPKLVPRETQSVKKRTTGHGMKKIKRSWRRKLAHVITPTLRGNSGRIKNGA